MVAKAEAAAEARVTAAKVAVKAVVKAVAKAEGETFLSCPGFVSACGLSRVLWMERSFACRSTAAKNVGSARIAASGIVAVQ